MIDVAALHQDLAPLRADAATAADAALSAMRALETAVSAARTDPSESATQVVAAAREQAAAATRMRDATTAALHERLRASILVASADDVIRSVPAELPVALLPVRIETAFDGPDAQPVLKVRIYPDDLHIEQHEPDLTQLEHDAGTAYWLAVQTAVAAEADDALFRLRQAYGADRAEWIKTVLTPITLADGTLQFPEVAIRRSPWSRPAVASTLPDQFIVRVRVGGVAHVAVGTAVRDQVQVGIDPQLAGDGDVDPSRPVVLDPGLLWMVDFDAAREAGMAVEIPLPPNTRFVDDVCVIGCCVSLDPDQSADRLNTLFASHRYAGGAGFVAPGTPTNNLADSTAGGAAPARPLAPAAPAVPPAEAGAGLESDASILAAALGLRDPALLAALSQRSDIAEARVMQQLLFEATWGPYLRELAQPGFPLERLPALRHHLIDHVRGGGALPTLRIGHQPYGVLPVVALQHWSATGGDDSMITWLVNLLRRVEPLWTGAMDRVPAGVASFSHEAVSSRVRMRTPIGSMTRQVFEGIDVFPTGSSPDVQERRLLAELGIAGVRPAVASFFYAKDAPNLWLPMAADEDMDFVPTEADPATAKSVLGLLLRDSARRLTKAVGTGLHAGIDLSTISVVAFEQTSAALAGAIAVSMPSMSTAAVSMNAALSVSRALPVNELLGAQVVDAAGTSFSVGERLEEVFQQHIALVERYNPADALAAFRDALETVRRIPPAHRARLTGEVLDCASHRFDAWHTSIADRRLRQVRTANPTGITLGAWGIVHGVSRRTLLARDGADLPAGTVFDPANGGHVLTPSVRHASTAGVLRAAWMAHDGPTRGADAPFAVELTSRRVRHALALADGMRTGQTLGALLGYQLERALHDAANPPPDGSGVELDWAVAPLRERYPLQVDSVENAGATAASARLVVDGWRLLQDEHAAPGTATQGLGAPDPIQLATLRTIIADLAGVLDALADLGVAEATYQLTGRNLERAAAATDMIGRATRPPDEFDDVITPRDAKRIEQRLVMTFSDPTMPDGWITTTPRSALCPLVDAFVARQLGDPAQVVITVVADDGEVLTSVSLGQVGLGALDLAADAATAAAGAVGPLLLAAARRVTATVHPDDVAATAVAVLDDAARGVLERAAAWHRALAGAQPLSAQHLSRPQDIRAAAGIAVNVLATMRQAIDRLAATAGGGDGGALGLWGVADTAEAQRRCDTARDQLNGGQLAEAVRTLFGGDAVICGAVPVAELPAAVVSAAARQNDLLGRTPNTVQQWLQDSARVRDAASRLDEAMLFDALAAAQPGCAPLVAQVPAAPYAAGTDAAVAQRWVGGVIPAELGPEPVTSIAMFSAGQFAVADVIEGLLLDQWSEAIPVAQSSAGVAMHLSAPDSRAPNTVLLAVPPVVGQPWTSQLLFDTVDTAMKLAQMRLVDLDAASRIPALLPAIYVEESDLDDFEVSTFLRQAVSFPQRWTWAVQQ